MPAWIAFGTKSRISVTLVVAPDRAAEPLAVTPPELEPPHPTSTPAASVAMTHTSVVAICARAMCAAAARRRAYRRAWRRIGAAARWWMCVPARSAGRAIDAPRRPRADTDEKAGDRTLSGEPVRELYTAADLPAGIGTGPQDPLGRPGQYHYTRGVYESMYRGRLWTMRQFAGFGTSEETNE